MIEMANNAYDDKLMAVLTAKLCLTLSFEAAYSWRFNFLAKVRRVGSWIESRSWILTCTNFSQIIYIYSI